MTFKLNSLIGTLIMGLGLLAVLSMSAAPVALAQREGSSSSSGNSNYVLDKPTYQAIQKIQKLMGQDKNNEAIARAKKLLPSAKSESDYAYALVNQLIANNYLIEKKYSSAEGYLKTALELDALQPRAQRSVVVQLATIYLSQKEYKKSISLYKKVIAQTKQKSGKKGEVQPRLYYHLGLAYSFADEYSNAYQYIHKAIVEKENMPATKNKQGKMVKPEVSKDWYQNLFIVVYKQKNYSKANSIAKTLVARWPNDKTFWSYYANTYLLLKKDKDALNVYALMAKKGMLKSKDEHMQLVSLLVEAHAPYESAKNLKKYMDEGIIPKNKDNYSLLSSLWMQAKDWDNALNALGKQAQLEESGDVYLRQASIYLSKLDYNKAVQSARKAIHKGGLKHPGQAWMLLGQAAFRAKDTHTALQAFHQASNYKAQREDAQGWIKYVSSTKKSQ
jgi:tetratricopeptide (TPR) repeat protein